MRKIALYITIIVVLIMLSFEIAGQQQSVQQDKNIIILNLSNQILDAQKAMNLMAIRIKQLNEMIDVSQRDLIDSNDQFLISMGYGNLARRLPPIQGPFRSDSTATDSS